jgi:hypothetical protein
MVLYRFLFAPVLLAVAVLAGSGKDSARPPPNQLPGIEAPAPAAGAADPSHTWTIGSANEPGPLRAR